MKVRFQNYDRPLRVGSVGWPVLKAASDQEYSVIRLFTIRAGHLKTRSIAATHG
jgi:hypothetical protein